MSTAQQAIQSDVNRILQDPNRYKRGGGKARGFARLTKEENRIVASRGGKRGHELKRAHEWTSEEARAAGKIGGRIGKRGKAKK